MRTIEIYISVAHPYKHKVPPEKIRAESDRVFGGKLGGLPFRFESATRGNTFTLCKFHLEATKIPPDHTVIDEIGKALKIKRDFGVDGSWTFLGWECWYTGMKWEFREDL